MTFFTIFSITTQSLRGRVRVGLDGLFVWVELFKFSFHKKLPRQLCKITYGGFF